MRPVGVGPRVGHGQDPGARVLEVGVYLASASQHSQLVARSRRRRRRKEEEGGGREEGGRRRKGGRNVLFKLSAVDGGAAAAGAGGVAALDHKVGDDAVKLAGGQVSQHCARAGGREVDVEWWRRRYARGSCCSSRA